MKLLFAAGADVNKPDNDGATPLFAALERRQLKAIKLLIGAGADVNKPTNNGATPLDIAAELGHHEAMKLLIEAGADVNKPIREGEIEKEDGIPLDPVNGRDSAPFLVLVLVGICICMAIFAPFLEAAHF